MVLKETENSVSFLLLRKMKGVGEKKWCLYVHQQKQVVVSQ